MSLARGGRRDDWQNYHQRTGLLFTLGRRGTGECWSLSGRHYRLYRSCCFEMGILCWTRDMPGP